MNPYFGVICVWTHICIVIHTHVHTSIYNTKHLWNCGSCKKPRMKEWRSLSISFHSLIFRYVFVFLSVIHVYEFNKLHAACSMIGRLKNSDILYVKRSENNTTICLAIWNGINICLACFLFHVVDKSEVFRYEFQCFNDYVSKLLKLLIFFC